jgi:hypothetical protein
MNGAQIHLSERDGWVEGGISEWATCPRPQRTLLVDRFPGHPDG